MSSLPTITHDYIMKGADPGMVPDISLGQFIIDRLKRHGNGVAQVNGVTGESITYSELLRKIVIISTKLRERGLRRGDAISICSENRFEFIQAALAALCVGVTCAPLNPIYTTREFEHALNISKPRLIFCSPIVLSKIEEAVKPLAYVEKIIVFGDKEDCEKHESFSELVKGTADVRSFKATPVNTAKDVVVVLCSSGTTGLPKGVELTHRNMINFIYNATDPRCSVASSKHVTLGLVPLFHGYGYGIMYITLSVGMKIVYLPMFTPEMFLQTIETYKITYISIVPPLMVLLAKSPLTASYDLSSLRVIMCGAAPLSSEVQNEVERKYPQISINQGYGMTELSIVSTYIPPGRPKIGSSGVVAPGNDCKVIDVENGKNLKPFEKGEVCFRGPLVMKGYRNNPKATAEAVEANGWIHTGDIGYYDNEGYLFIVDRLKELIKYKGFQVPPAELEAILLTHPEIKDAAVIGIPDEAAGELPRAFVVKQEDSNLKEEDVVKFVFKQVSPQKRLHGGVQFVESIPKNPSGKILRRELRDTFRRSKL